tara:strand:+ start:121 stop:1284 length:1164 start_codon:yes stop_codon:yes gene_type:complete
MALSKIDVANMLTGATPVANGGTALTSGFVNGRANNQMAPIIVNGDMAVAQRNTGTVAQADSSNEGYATVDRFQTQFANSAGGTITTSRDTTAPTGFGQSMKFDVTSADTSVGSTHVVYTAQTVEAQVMRNSGWDYTSSSSYITLSFQIRSSKTGTYCVFLYTNDGSAKMYTAEYTVSSADTWEQKVIAIPGNSNLTFNNDNGNGVQIGWTWACGTDRDGTAETWSDLAFATSNQVNFLDSTSNVAYLTGVQLEVGQFTSSTLPAFQQESFGDNLARCQRYYLNYLEGTGKIVGMTASYTSSEVVLMHNFPTTMRSAPTLEISTGSSYYQHGEAGSVQAITGSDISIDRATLNGAQLLLTSMSANSGDGGFIYTGSSSSKISYTAEL